MRKLFATLALSVTLVGALSGEAPAQDRRLEAGVEAPVRTDLTPEQRMARRFPQAVRAGFLIGLPLLDVRDRTLGRVEQVVRDGAGQVTLVVRRSGWFDAGQPVGVPIETVAILARQIALLDIPRDAFLASPEWRDTGAARVAENETLRIAITRR
ncbi:PRC-barrel domain-containing protein [Plastoroseomonas arctica]|uniref:PRC-barrel domain containing protein n=1 Tax=Plastoroseomonas arctica TaxID=1509237 RepID=A0AAF1K5R0_9PROT|nr:PRC-barrel domain-containing protein [Plastoroseomonas arctica]MBR0656840.1 PRC-barrel domain containing protein [Plastoroseomonas arctica]